MHHMFFLLGFFVVGCLSSPQEAEIVQYNNEQNIDSYNYAFQTSDGTYRAESGNLKNAGSEDEALSVSGIFQYVGPDGVTYTVNYIADENGFQPTGDHIPKFP